MVGVIDWLEESWRRKNIDNFGCGKRVSVR